MRRYDYLGLGMEDGPKAVEVNNVFSKEGVAHVWGRTDRFLGTRLQDGYVCKQATAEMVLADCAVSRTIFEELGWHGSIGINVLYYKCVFYRVGMTESYWRGVVFHDCSFIDCDIYNAVFVQSNVTGDITVIDIVGADTARFIRCSGFASIIKASKRSGQGRVLKL